MTEARHGQDGDDELVEELLLEVLDAADIEVALAAACAAHPAQAGLLRRMAGRMLSDQLLGDDAFMAAPAPAGGQLPERVGPYRLLRRLGAGGMGVVFAARDDRLRRVVAVKLVRPELLWFEGSRERFLREVAAVARLRHPHIVALHEFGEQDGLPYYAMELIDGGSLSERLNSLRGRAVEQLRGADLHRGAPPLEAHGTSSRADLGAGEAGSWPAACALLVQQVAAALQHAHEQGVVHRDIKPSNVLLDSEGRARIVDFGLARTADGGELTRSASQIGSQPYMPPEQVAGRLERHGPAQDVYSLGVTLYEALTLTNPFLASPFPVGSVEETGRRILAAAAPPPRRLNRRISWELETVCLCAMAPEVGRRYATMAEFAADLEAARTRRPIRARRAGVARRGWRWTQRHPLRVTLGMVAVLLFGVLPVVFGFYQREVSAEMRRLADRAEQRAYLASLAGAASGLAAGDAGTMRDSLLLCPPDRRGFAWRRLAALSDVSERQFQLGEPVVAVAGLGEAGRVVAATSAGELAWIDLAAASMVRQPLGTGGNVVGLFPCDEGRGLLSVGRDGGVLRGGLDRSLVPPLRKVREVWRADAAIEAAAWNDAQGLLAIGRQDGVLDLVDLGATPPTSTRLLSMPASDASPVPVVAVEFSADGSRLAVARPGGVVLFDAPFGPGGGRTVLPTADHRTWVLLMAFVDPAGDELLYLTQDRDLAWLDFASGELLGGRMAVADVEARDLLVPPGLGALVLAGNRGLTVRSIGRDGVWLPEIARPRIGHRGEVRCVDWVPGEGDASWLVSGGADGVVRGWTLGSGSGVVRCPSTPSWVDLSLAGGRGLVGMKDGSLAVLDLRRGTLGPRGPSIGARISRLAIVDERRALAVDVDGGLHRVDWSGPRPQSEPQAIDGGVAEIVVAHGSASFVALLGDPPRVGRVVPGQPLDPANFRALQPWPDAGSSRLLHVAVAADGGVLLASDDQHRVWGWDVASGVCRGLLARHGLGVTDLCVARGAARGFSAGRDGQVRVYDLDAMRELEPPIELGDRRIEALAVTADGRELALGTVRGYVELWDVPGRVRLVELRGHSRGVYNLEFSADEELLVSSSWDGSLRLRAAPRR